MVRILVTAVGSDGDINPMIEIARALLSRGHDVRFIANGSFAHKAEEVGLPFLPLGDSSLFQEVVSDPDLWHPRKGFSAVWRNINQSLPLSLELLEQNMEPGNTILVGTTLALACRVLQEKSANSVPLATVHLSPACLISRYDPPQGPVSIISPQTPQFLKDLYLSLVEVSMLENVCRDDVNRFRARFGLAPVKRIFARWLNSPDLVVLAFPEWYAQRQKDWPDNLCYTGFPLFDRKQEQRLSDATRAFIDAGAAPVVFTAGSAMAHSRDYFSHALKCVRARNIRAIFVTRYPEVLPRHLPDNVLHASYEPFDHLFAEAAVVAHHGGIGTSAQGLRAAVPQLVCPFAHDQFDNARRLEALGVAREIRVQQPKQWAGKLGELLDNPEVKVSCHKVKELMTVCPDPAAKAAETIEGLAKKLRK
ncbi:MAG: glycosyltransferase [Candidatus Melainabacteria bacterium]|nr:glycosyltransferase [Candidatus Melainabacteria bacterium]